MLGTFKNSILLHIHSTYAVVFAVGYHMDNILGYDITTTIGEALDLEIHVFLVLFSGLGFLPSL